jgi:hypothetical protein
VLPADVVDATLARYEEALAKLALPPFRSAPPHAAAGGAR